MKESNSLASISAVQNTDAQDSPTVPNDVPRPPIAQPAQTPAPHPQIPSSETLQAQQQPAAPHSADRPPESGPQRSWPPSEDRSNLVSVWHGQLAKSGVVKCKVEVLAKRPDQKPSWPALLDVRNRVAVDRAMEQPKHVLYVTARNDASDRRHFHEFCKYLTEKQRAGVVAVGSPSDQQRELYLVPGCAAVFKQLRLKGPQQECLVAVPKRSE